MFDKEEAMMLYKMVEMNNFRGKDCVKVVNVLNILDKHIVKLLEVEEKSK